MQCKGFIFFLIKNFIYGCVRSLLLHGPFSSCREWGLLSLCFAQASLVVASLVVEYGL